VEIATAHGASNVAAFWLGCPVIRAGADSDLDLLVICPRRTGSAERIRLKLLWEERCTARVDLISRAASQAASWLLLSGTPFPCDRAKGP